MCGGSAPKPQPVAAKQVTQPPAQPPSITSSAAEVNIGSREEGESSRRRVGRSQLRSNINVADSGRRKAGLGV